MATSTVLQQQTAAYNYGILQKKSPSVFAGHQQRLVINLVDMLVYHSPPKTEGGEAGAMKGFVMHRDILDINKDEDSTNIGIVVKGREYNFKAVDKASQDLWYRKLKFAQSVINDEEPQQEVKIKQDSLWGGNLLGISIKNCRVVGLNWDYAKTTQGWRLGDRVVAVNDIPITDQNHAVQKLREVREQPLPFYVTVKRFSGEGAVANHDAGATGLPEPSQVIKEHAKGESKGADPDEADADDCQVDVDAGKDTM